MRRVETVHCLILRGFRFIVFLRVGIDEGHSHSHTLLLFSFHPPLLPTAGAAIHGKMYRHQPGARTRQSARRSLRRPGNAGERRLRQWSIFLEFIVLFFLAYCVVWIRFGAGYLTAFPGSESRRSKSTSITQLQIVPAAPNRTIAYLTSLTKCPADDLQRKALMDSAAVLKESIHLVSSRNLESTSKYDYDMHVFLHPNALDCEDTFAKLGYNVLVRETPVSYDELQNHEYRKELYNEGCCGEKELLKLYSYTMHEYKLVLHLDLDMMLLKPLDELFDVFYASSTTIHIPHTRWPKDETSKRQSVEFMFTRDYPMVKAGAPSHQVGVQGGFLLIRPNQTAFEEIISLVKKGNYRNGWFDGDVHYPSLYGSPQIQGLLAFYYGHYHPEKAIELDPCIHNNYAQNPRDHNGKCRFPRKGKCDNDCRTKDVSELYSVHFLYCYKPVRRLTYNGQCPWVFIFSLSLSTEIFLLLAVKMPQERNLFYGEAPAASKPLSKGSRTVA